MPRVRYKHKNTKSPYWLEAYNYRLARAYALGYEGWKKERQAVLNESARALRYNDMPKSEGVNVVEECARKAAELLARTEKVEQVAIETDAELYRWILKSVTSEHTSAEELIRQGMPCSTRTLLRRRKKFYFLLAQKI